jgi:hypothetical protein
VRATHVSSKASRRGGRPAKLTEANKRFCVRAIACGGLSTSAAVADKLKTELDVTVSPQTVRNTLRRAGLGAIEKKPKPFLSQRNIRQRLAFANKHKHWTVDDWRRVIWSDESKINRFSTDGRSWAWVRDDEPLQSQHVKQTVKYGGGNIKVWGCFTYEGVGELVQIEGTMDQQLYLSILQDDLLNTINNYDLDPSTIIFQHDNDPKHTAKSVTRWLDQQEFDVLTWSAQSPDLNPIENLWAIVKRRLNTYPSPPKGVLELWERVQAIWQGIDGETCARLVDSMPRRVQAVLAAKGKWTDY